MRYWLGLAIIAALLWLAGDARGRAPLPPAVGVCAEARPAARGVDIPAEARVVTMGPVGAQGRPWACWVEGRTP